MAGVVGQYKFVYDIFGDAVNVASRMETTSEAARIEPRKRQKTTAP